MALEINLSPEDIERLVKDSIMRSGFGAAVEKALRSAMSGYDNPIEKSLRQYVGSVCDELIRAHYADKIKAAISSHLEKSITTELVEKTTSEAVRRMVKAAEDRNY